MLGLDFNANSTKTWRWWKWVTLSMPFISLFPSPSLSSLPLLSHLTLHRNINSQIFNKKIFNTPSALYFPHLPSPCLSYLLSPVPSSPFPSQALLSPVLRAESSRPPVGHRHCAVEMGETTTFRFYTVNSFQLSIGSSEYQFQALLQYRFFWIFYREIYVVRRKLMSTYTYKEFGQGFGSLWSTGIRHHLPPS